MARIREQLDREAESYGINVVDVRIRRADLPEQNSQAVYQRMQTERQREAAEFRAQGAQRAQEIRSRADRDVTVLIAEANSKAEQIRGEGDGERNRIFADAFSKDPDFFAFYRSMQAYESGLKATATPGMVLRPDSEFFRYLRRSIRQDAGQRATGSSSAPAGATPPARYAPTINRCDRHGEVLWIFIWSRRSGDWRSDPEKAAAGRPFRVGRKARAACRTSSCVETPDRGVADRRRSRWCSG